MRAERGMVVQVKAPAKINLALRVQGKRPDGYHELRTTFQSLALSDTLTFRARPGPLEISCNDLACPTDATNLVWRAAAGVWTAAGRRGMPRDVSVRIVKTIPIQAGLGGGSSNGAAAIRALSALWRVKLARQHVREIARALGADVPFFLVGGTVTAVGRGDELISQADTPPASVVVIVPSFGISTKEAYRWWDESQRRTATRRRNALNDLEAPVTARYPEIAQLVRALRRYGARDAAMSGSGSAVFGLFDRRSDADEAASHLARGARRVMVTRTLNRSGYARLVRPGFRRATGS
jgi:4-diphosphocytidyl-2-C-methyl-D-erythritol kinase